MSEVEHDMTTGKTLSRTENTGSENLPEGILSFYERYNSKTGLLELRLVTYPGNGDADSVRVIEHYDSEGKLTQRITEDMPKYDKNNSKTEFPTKRKTELFGKDGNINGTIIEVPFLREDGSTGYRTVS